jgi:hypothetical protein
VRTLDLLVLALALGGCAAAASSSQDDEANLMIGAGCVNFAVCGPGYTYWNPTLGGRYYTGLDQTNPLPMDGKVGLPFEERSSARCKAGWTAKARVVSGALPPGLRIGEDLSIVGVPERAGVWYLQVQHYDIQCGGRPVNSVVQTLAIHTVGSSAPRPVQ